MVAAASGARATNATRPPFPLFLKRNLNSFLPLSKLHGSTVRYHGVRFPPKADDRRPSFPRATSRLIPRFPRNLSSLFQPNRQIPRAKAGSVDKMVRVLLRCCPERPVHFSNSGNAQKLRYNRQLSTSRRL